MTLVPAASGAALASVRPISPGVVDADVAAGAAIAQSKIAGSIGITSYHNHFDFINTSATSSMLSQSIPGNTFSANSGIFWIIEGFVRNNSGATHFLQFTVSYGGSALWNDNTPTIPNSTTFRPFLWVGYMANEGATNAQRAAGQILIYDTTAALGGLGAFAGAAHSGVVHSGNAAIDSTGAATFALQVAWDAAGVTSEIAGQAAAFIL